MKFQDWLWIIAAIVASLIIGAQEGCVSLKENELERKEQYRIGYTEGKFDCEYKHYFEGK